MKFASMCLHLLNISDGCMMFLWQDGLVSVSEFLCGCMDEMLGAASNDHSQTSAQPQPGWLEKMSSTD